MRIFELVPRYDTRKSFYGKARVVDHENGTVTVKFKASGELEILWHLFKWGNAVKIISPRS